MEFELDMPVVSIKELRKEREERAAAAAASGLFAEIKESSKYFGQADGRFPVALYADGEYIVHGARNRYRLADVTLFWSNGSGQLLPC